MTAFAILCLAAMVALLVVATWDRWQTRRHKSELAMQAALVKAPEHPEFVERHAADIWASRLVALCIRSGTVFPHPEGKTPVEGVWVGTAEQLRDALLCAASRLHRGERWEVPSVAALEARLKSMVHHGGRVRVECVPVRDYQARRDLRGWRLTLGR
ncbi:MAG TPA: hypothetical protein VK477_11115 [Acidobacteriota bacterium]|nr:hypothetical protein [Acidobacteriota bacterium]